MSGNLLIALSVLCVLAGEASTVEVFFIPAALLALVGVLMHIKGRGVDD